MGGWKRLFGFDLEVKMFGSGAWFLVMWHGTANIPFI